MVPLQALRQAKPPGQQRPRVRPRQLAKATMCYSAAEACGQSQAQVSRKMPSPSPMSTRRSRSARIRRGQAIDAAGGICSRAGMRPKDVAHPDGKRGASSVHLPTSERPVESEIDLQDIHTWLAEQAEQAAFDVLLDNCAHLLFRQPPCSGNARHLPQGVGRADIRIQP